MLATIIAPSFFDHPGGRGLPARGKRAIARRKNVLNMERPAVPRIIDLLQDLATEQTAVAGFISGGDRATGEKRGVKAPRANDFVERELKECNRRLGELLNSDVIIMKSPIRFGLDDTIRSEVENLPGPGQKRADGLTPKMESGGSDGYERRHGRPVVGVLWASGK